MTATSLSWISTPRQRLAGLGAMLVLITVAGAVVHRPAVVDADDDTRLAIFIGLECVAGLIYLAAVALTLRASQALDAVWIVLGIAALLRLVVLPEPPLLSTDLYRYIWDGRVQVEGINPYRYVPTDAALAALRDEDVFFRMNRADYAHTIYPPLAQMIFHAVAYVSQTPLAIKATMVLFELVAIWATLKLLGLAALDRTRILIYAWNPLPVWEFAGNGHIDAAALGFIAVAMLAHVRRRDALTGLMLGAAAAVKLLPAILAPALWRRWDWRMPLAMAATIVTLYLYYAEVGWGVLGFLPNYARDEGLASGAGIYWLWALSHVVTLPDYAGRLWLAASAIGLVGLGTFLAFSRRDAATPQAEVVATAQEVCVMATALMILVTPHYPWYFAWLALPACLVPVRSVIFIATAAMILHFDVWHEKILWPTLIWLPFAALMALDYRRGASALAIPIHATSGRSN